MQNAKRNDGRGFLPPSDAQKITEAMSLVQRAGVTFESRWTRRALERVDPELHERFVDQESIFHEALIVGDLNEVEIHAAAMCRGYAAVTEAMVKANVPDDAYLLGQDSKTGTKVAISDQRQVNDRVRELHGDAVVFVTPDEVAAMVAGLEELKRVKNVFPDAEVIQLRPREPAKEDG